MSAPDVVSPVAEKAIFIPTAIGGFIHTGAIFLGADNASVEVLEWSPELTPANRATFEQALKIGDGYDADGGGWHLPTPQEWLSVVNYEKFDPATDAPGVESSWYWTRQRDPSSPSVNAFYVSLRGGLVYWNSQGYRGRVRACRRVRASQFLTLGL